MVRLNRHWPAAGRAALVGLSIAVLSLAVLGPAVITAHAEPSSYSASQTYCLSLLNDPVRSACTGPMLQRSDNNPPPVNVVASYYCTSASLTDQASCITNKANSFIKQAADKNPRTASQFTNDLQGILKATGYSLTKPTQASQQSLPPQTTCVDAGSTSCTDPAISCTSDQCDLIAKYVDPTIKLLAAVFGTVAAISIIMGGINYATSEGDPQKAGRAKSRITNTIIAVVAFLFLYAFLQFLIPGGIFNR